MINYLVGDATEPIVKQGIRVIPHVCNNVGKFGKGFAEALNHKWKEPRTDYLKWFAKKYTTHHITIKTAEFELGEIQTVPVLNNPHTIVINMIAQNGTRSKNNPIPLDYKALETCLTIVSKYCSMINTKELPVTIHMPKIGTGLAGGEWLFIQLIIEKTLANQDVYIYEWDKSLIKF